MYCELETHTHNLRSVMMLNGAFVFWYDALLDLKWNVLYYNLLRHSSLTAMQIYIQVDLYSWLLAHTLILIMRDQQWYSQLETSNDVEWRSLDYASLYEAISALSGRPKYYYLHSHSSLTFIHMYRLTFILLVTKFIPTIWGQQWCWMVSGLCFLV